MMLKIMSILLVFSMYSCSEYTFTTYDKKDSNALYAARAEEHQVQFEALYFTQASKPSQVSIYSLKREIESTTQFLFGPTTHRSLAGIQKGARITPHLDRAVIRSGRVVVPYTYNGKWLIDTALAQQGSMKMPVPLSISDLKSPAWKNCTDRAEDHATWDFFWYFWDPTRYGCDHQLNKNYQEVDVAIGELTVPTTLSYPEYNNLIHYRDGKPYIAMTFAFGYVEDVNNPNPYKDTDYGMIQFQQFYKSTKNKLLAKGLKELPVYQKDITYGETQIGSRFVGLVDGVNFEVTVIAAAGVDQMDIFAYSYALRHDGFFGWFGHSRVGSGFDAEVFEKNLRLYPDKFTISPEYQLVYWAGCNSYSYYTLPFFSLKAKYLSQVDPLGTKKLDLISNGLPSLFDFNSFNANVMLQAILNYKTPTSYQSLVNKLESHAKDRGYVVLVNVLGDEDNAP